MEYRLTREEYDSVLSIGGFTPTTNTWNNKVAAIKRVRELTRAGLKESKDFVESPDFVYLPKLGKISVVADTWKIVSASTEPSMYDLLDKLAEVAIIVESLKKRGLM